MFHACKVWFYYHFGITFTIRRNYSHEQQYAKREAVDGDKEAKVSDERDKVVQEMAMF